MNQSNVVLYIEKINNFINSGKCETIGDLAITKRGKLVSIKGCEDDDGIYDDAKKAFCSQVNRYLGSEKCTLSSDITEVTKLLNKRKIELEYEQFSHNHNALYLSRKLGSGYQSNVIVAEGPTRRYAFKIHSNQAQSRKERKILAMFDHKNIIKNYPSLEQGKDTFAIESFPHDEEDFEMVEIKNVDFSLITDIKNTTLKDSIKKGELNHDQQVDIAGKILNAVAYLQTMKVAHLDIKSDNILLDDEFEPFLIDFGFAEIGHYHESIPVTGYGPNGPWEAKKAWIDKFCIDGYKADAWATGYLLIEIFSDTNDFSNFENEIKNRLLTYFKFGDYAELERIEESVNKCLENICNKLSLAMQQTMKKLLEIYPENRLTVKNCLDRF